MPRRLIEQPAADVATWCSRWSQRLSPDWADRLLESLPGQLDHGRAEGASARRVRPDATVVLRTVAFIRLFAACDPVFLTHTSAGPSPPSRPASPPTPDTDSQLQAALGSDALAQLDELCDRATRTCRQHALLNGLHPVAAWYERWIATHDRDARRARGVYYTPQSVVAFMVRIAGELSGRYFPGRPLSVIDPACGCGLFLLEAARTPDLLPSNAEGSSSVLLGSDVSWSACRLTAGFLALRARMSVLAQRPSIRNLNPLDHEPGEFLGNQAADAPVPVIIGNPPYYNFGKQNRGDRIRSLMAAYKVGLREKKHNLDDDFIKFMRWGQHVIDERGVGLLAMITSSTYLRALTHRVMRESLLGSFDSISIVDLGGNQGGIERTAEGQPDENIFGIRSGVSIGFFLKTSSDRDVPCNSSLRYWSLGGTRDQKLTALDHAPHYDSICWKEPRPAAPRFLMAPVHVGSTTYRSWPNVTDCFPEFISGVQTKNDRRFVDHDRTRLAERIRGWLEDEQASGRHVGVAFEEHQIRRYQVAPFDRRWIYYEPRLLGRARYSVMRHLLSEQHANVALVFMRQSTNRGPYDHALVTRHLVSDRVFYSRHGAPFIAPLWLDEGDGRRANVADEPLSQLKQMLPDWPTEHRVEAFFNYAYAILQSPEYRALYEDELRVDFPRIPWPTDRDRFVEAAEVGRSLARLHQSSPGRMRVATETRSSPADGSPAIMKLRYDAAAERLWITRQRWCDGVPPEVWETTIGGYPVLARWIKQRRDLPWSAEIDSQLAHLVRVLRRTYTLRQRLHFRWLRVQ